MKRQLKLVLSTAVLGTLLVSGCAAPEQPRSTASVTPSAEQPSADQEQLTEVGVGVLSIVDVAPLYLGMKEGIFEKHGLKILPEAAQGGAVIVTGVSSGQFQFGFSNVTSLAVARDKGLGVKIVAPASASTGVVGEDYTAVMTSADSGIEDPADLIGKRVAVNTLGNILDSTVSAALRQRGIDPAGVKFVEMPFPDMVGQLNAGNVDAIVVSEPFVTVAKDDDNTVVLSNYAEATEDLTVATYFAMEDYIEKNPEVVQRFQAAVVEAQEFSAANPDQVRQILTEFTRMEADVAERVILSKYPTEINREAIADVAKMAETDGLLKDADKVSDLVLD